MGNCCPCCTEEDDYSSSGNPVASYGSLGGVEVRYGDSTEEHASYEASVRASTDDNAMASYEASGRASTDDNAMASYEASGRASTDDNASLRYEASGRAPTDEMDNYYSGNVVASYGDSTNEIGYGDVEASGRDSEMAGYGYGHAEASERNSADEMAGCQDDVVAASGGGSADVTEVVARALQSQVDPSEVRLARAAVSKMSFRIVGKETTYFKLTLGLEASRFDGLVERFCKRYQVDDYYKQSLMDGKYSELNANFVEQFCFTVNEMGGVVSGVFVSRKVTETKFDVACAIYTVKLKVTERYLTHRQQEHLRTYFIDKARKALFIEYPALK